jgi:hypothetical protein
VLSSPSKTKETGGAEDEGAAMGEGRGGREKEEEVEGGGEALSSS